MNKLTEQEASRLITGKLSRYFGVSPQEATREQIYKAVVMSVRDIMAEKHQKFHLRTKNAKAKRVYYLCMEFLMGRSLKNSVYNLGIYDALSEALKGFKTNLEDLYEEEPDAGLGNGGLGRLAACFLDGLASQNYPAMGFSICYQYGLFKQKIVDGWQIELPDIWLPGGESWLIQRTDKRFIVRFEGSLEEKWTDHGMETIYRNAREVEAVAYDMMVSGKDSDAVSTLRLWRARAVQKFDMQLFSQGNYAEVMMKENRFASSSSISLFRRPCNALFPITSVGMVRCLCFRRWRQSTSTIRIPLLRSRNLCESLWMKTISAGKLPGISRLRPVPIRTTLFSPRRSKLGLKSSSHVKFRVFTQS